MGIEEWDVENILPHRSPFLFVGEIIRVEPGVEAEAWSNVPAVDLAELACPTDIVPLWYVAEFLAQTGALAVLAGRQGEKTLMTGIDSLELFSQPVPDVPLRAEVRLLQERRGIGKRAGVVYQGEKKIAAGVIWYARQ